MLVGISGCTDHQGQYEPRCRPCHLDIACPRRMRPYKIEAKGEAAQKKGGDGWPRIKAERKLERWIPSGRGLGRRTILYGWWRDRRRRGRWCGKEALDGTCRSPLGHPLLPNQIGGLQLARRRQLSELLGRYRALPLVVLRVVPLGHSRFLFRDWRSDTSSSLVRLNKRTRRPKWLTGPMAHRRLCLQCSDTQSPLRSVRVSEIGSVNGSSA